MKFLVAAVLLVASTGVLAQNPYEYVDDALIQRVGQIIYDFDQKVAASRSNGNTGAFSGSGYQVGKPEGVSRVSNFDYNNVKQVQPQQQVYQQRPVARAVQQPQHQIYQQQPVARAVQQQQVYQQRPVARAVQQPQQQVYQQPQQQQVYQQRPVSRSVQQPIMQQQQVYQNFRSQRQFTPSAPVARTVQEPEMVQKNSGFGYVLSQPEIVPRVAEFHFTDGEQDSQSQDSFRVNNNRRF